MDSEIDLPEQRIPFFILMNKQVSSDVIQQLWNFNKVLSHEFNHVN